MATVTNGVGAASSAHSTSNGQGTARPSPPDDSAEQLVQSAAHGDAPASTWQTDYLGFTPYVEHVRDFLLNESTETPLCMSVEGRWGSGKSSFLRQLQGALADAKARTVLFEAWRHNNDESMWASFALESIQQLRNDRTLGWKVRAAALLGLKRIDWGEASFKVLELAVRLGLFIFVTLAIVFYFFHGGAHEVGAFVAKQTKSDDVFAEIVAKAGGAVAYLFLTIALLKNVRELVGDPFDADLIKITADPGYRSKLGFAKKFHTDLTKVLQTYTNGAATSRTGIMSLIFPTVAPSKKTFFLIDDLDRCDVPAIADLIAAVNVIASTEASGAVFIIAMDRQVVAASLALKYQELVPFLTFAEDNAKDDVLLRRGLDYGSAFMEKFVQLPFRVPSADDNDLERMTKGDATETRRLERYRPNGKAGVDSDRILTLQRAVAFVFEFNPRRIKQFGNMYRLNLLISANPKVHTLKTHDYKDGTTPELYDLTVEKLGKWLALILRWPRFVDRLSQNRTLLAELQRHALNPLHEVTGEAQSWAADQTLINLLRVDETIYYNADDFSPERRLAIFSLEAINVDALLRLAPPVGTLQSDLTARDPHVQSELVLATFKPVGSHSLVRNARGPQQRKLELIVPGELGGLAHFAYDPGAVNEGWTARTALDVTEKFVAASHIQSSFDDGNLELIALPAVAPAAAPAGPAIQKETRQVRFYWRRASNAANWKGPYNVGVEATGKPFLFQIQSGTQGNFILLVQSAAGLLEYGRDNSRIRREWRGPNSSVALSKTAQPLAVYQERASAPSSELRAVVFDSGELRVRKSTANGWESSMPILTNVTGTPAVMVRSLAPKTLDLVLAEGGRLSHRSYDFACERWSDAATIDSGLGEVEAIHGTCGDNERLDLVVRARSNLLHYFVEGPGLSWQGPLNILDQIRTANASAATAP